MDGTKALVSARINGAEARFVVDTGAFFQMISPAVAAQYKLELQPAPFGLRRAGISPDSPGAVRLGMISGIGPEPVAVWSVPVDVFEIGGEKIEHTRVAVADIDLPPPLDADMLLGADFFLAHHVYVANSQGKLYFTYNGGPVFNLSVLKSGQAAPGSLDAAGLLRRGMGYASRQEFALALADLTRACDLAPKDEQCRYQRGLAYWRSGQPAPALADLDTAVTLDPGDFQARLARAQLEIRQRPSAVEDDLDAVDHLAPPEANLRLAVGQLYDHIGEYAGAVHQYDLWIDYHADDVSLPFALADRCGSEAMANVDVDRGLDDCNRALRMIPKAAPIRTSAVTMSDRGLIYLRLRKIDKALADFAAALKLQPSLPVALYGRGLAEQEKGLKTEGQADLAAAAALRPGLSKRLASFGLAH